MAVSPQKSLVPVTRWWWVRHAPVRDDGGRIYGQVDLESDCSADNVFQSLASILPRGALWVTSHLRRTKQTAAAIHAAGNSVATGIHETKAFAEQDFGDWQGLDRKDFFASRSLAPHSFWYCPAHERPPGGESFHDLIDRVRPAVEQLTRDNPGRDIVAVAHGGTIRAALAIAMDLEPEASLAFATDNCAVTRLDHIGGDARFRWRVGFVNHSPWLGASAPSIPQA
jgi:broad specificity phosphatase PhoE